MKNKFAYIVFILAIFLSSSCTKNFDKINTDPNSVQKIEPEFLFTTAVFNSMKLYDGPMKRSVFFNYTQHFSGFQGEFQRYNYNVSENNQFWKQTYVDILQPVFRIIEEYKTDNNYHNRVTIAKIWKAYIYSNTLAIWGSVPLEGSLLGEPSIPYTNEKTAYSDLLNDLKQLALDINLDGDRFSPNSDKIYNGDLLKWKKFANSLRLRIAMRISNPLPNGDPELARSHINDLFQNRQLLISSDNETAQAKWGTISNDWNPLYDRVIYNYQANLATLPVLGESLVYHTAPYHDPRLAVWAKPATQGPFKGRFFGQNISYGGGSEFASNSESNPHKGLKQVDYSPIGDVFTKMDAYCTFLSYAEIALLKSEAALNGWWDESAEKLYNEGIKASMMQYAINEAAAQAYLEEPGIKWGTASDTIGRETEFKDWLQICSSSIGKGDTRRQIIMQQWLALTMQGLETWTLMRRTQLLEFEPQFATYDGDYKYMPQRLPYPSDEYNANAEEIQKALPWLNGPDNLETKLWFALPNRKNPYLPY